MNRRARYPLAALVAACALVIAAFAYAAAHSRTVETRATARDENYNRLVDGFRAGRLDLPVAVPPGLAQLPDPYDPLQNGEFRYAPYWLHDLSYHDGRFYLYFGATPAVVLFWPWRVVTGRYLSQPAAVAIFCGIEFLVALAMLVRLRRRHFPEVSGWTLAAGALALGLATGVPILLQRAEFWEVAVTCATMLMMIALALVWLAVDLPARRGAWLAAASAAYGLALGARPSCLFGAAILLLPVAVAWRERRAFPWRLLLAAVVPVAIGGVAVLLYNDRRFGDPLQFGERYQLAADRQDAIRHFGLGYVWFNLRVYFLAPVQWSRFVPFVGDVVSPRPPAGHAPVESAYGVLRNMPVLVLAAVVPCAWLLRGRAALAGLRGKLVAAGWLFASSAAVMCLFYGSCWRYEMEFMPALALLAVVGLFVVERLVAARPVARIAGRCGCGLVLAGSIGFNLLEAANQHANELCRHGAILLDTGQPAAAAAEFTAALRFRPHDELAHAHLGDAWMQLRRAPEAVQAYSAALAVDDAEPQRFYDLAHARLELGERDAAAALLEQGLQVETAEARAGAETASRLAAKPDGTAAALAQQVRVIQLETDLARAHFNRGNILAPMRGRAAEAIDEFEQTLRLAPDNASAHNNVAMLYASIGRPDKAIPHLEAALQIDPHYAKAQANLRAVEGMLR